MLKETYFASCTDETRHTQKQSRFTGTNRLLRRITVYVI